MSPRQSRTIKPEHNKTRINKAGSRVRSGNATWEDLEIINNWRVAHNKILNDWQATLRNRCKGRTVVFAQRLKRMPTIMNKLSRQNGMQLARMHDIAGCRLIFPSIETLEDFRASVHEQRSNHVRRKSKEDPYPYDYISLPKASGYRGIHDVYAYQARPGRDASWDGLMVEIQYRTEAQHAWATAVELAGEITGQHTKFDQGGDAQKEFFRLASEIIARTKEGRKSCCSDLSSSELVTRFEELEQCLHLLNTFRSLDVLVSWRNKVKDTEPKFFGNLVLVGDATGLQIYSADTLPEATRLYSRLEQENPSANVVLVRTSSEESLRNAYKNYFGDTSSFVALIEDGLGCLR